MTTLRINKASLIQRLQVRKAETEATIAEMKKTIADREAAVAAHTKATAEWHRKLAKALAADPSVKFGLYSWGTGSELHIKFAPATIADSAHTVFASMPAEPVFDKPLPNLSQEESKLKDISNTLSLLELADGDTVTASAYKNVTQYL